MEQNMTNARHFQVDASSQSALWCHVMAGAEMESSLDRPTFNKKPAGRFLLQEAFLAKCNESWGPRELRAVRRKLGSIGVHRVGELLCRGPSRKQLNLLGPRL